MKCPGEANPQREEVNGWEPRAGTGRGPAEELTNDYEWVQAFFWGLMRKSHNYCDKHGKNNQSVYFKWVNIWHVNIILIKLFQ